VSMAAPEEGPEERDAAARGSEERGEEATAAEGGVDMVGADVGCLREKSSSQHVDSSARLVLRSSHAHTHPGMHTQRIMQSWLVTARLQRLFIVRFACVVCLTDLPLHSCRG
jgi:hypothetical protein